MIIGLNGYGGSGKDAIGVIIQYLNCNNVGKVSLEEAISNYKDHEWWLEDQSGWSINKWAGKLKQMATLLTGLPMSTWESQEMKAKYLPEEWNLHGMPMTIRELLQKIGTDAIREGLHPDAWVNAVMSDYRKASIDIAGDVFELEPNWILTDTRFPNEFKAVKDSGGIMVRVDRPDVKPANDHPSEVALDNHKFDYHIYNGGSILDLADSVRELLEKVNYGK